MNDPTTSARDISAPTQRKRRPSDVGRQPALPGRPDPGRTSLAEVRPGDIVEIVEIFFEIVRNQCWALGLVVGDTCECVAVDATEIVLVHPIAGRVSISSDSARFVLTRPRALGVGIAGTPGRT